jgi:hypothetical protein
MADCPRTAPLCDVYHVLHSFSLGHHTTVFQAEIYAIKACIMENIEKGYKGRNIYILSDSH